MVRRFSELLAYVSHPVFTPFYLSSLLHWLCPNWYFVPFQSLLGVTILFPLLILYVMKRLGWLSSFSKMSLKERRITLAVSGLYYLTWMILVRESAYGALCACLVLSHYFLYVFSFKQKPSLHTYSWVGGWMVLLGSNRFLCEVPYTILIFWGAITILVIASRLYLKAHTIREVILGLMISVVMVFLVFLTHYGI